MKIPTDETLAIDDTHGDDFRGGDWGAGHGGWQLGKVTDMEVDKVADMKIPIEDLTEVILEILVFE